MIHKNWAELIKPTQLEVRPGADPSRVATVVAEPLERGFGLTLGNALRRVLLSSLQGAAITSVQIDNVLHEFSSVAGVREDVTDIVLNLKGVSLRMEVEGPKRLSINATGPGAVTAGDIAETAGIEVLNKDHVICHLDEGATLNMELTADTGKGYRPAVMNRPADAPIGLIPVDSLYSPVRQVSYKVENARVGQELDALEQLVPGILTKVDNLRHYFSPITWVCRPTAALAPFSAFEDAEDIVLAHDDVFGAVELDLVARILAEEDAISPLYRGLDQLAVVGRPTDADGYDLALLGLFLGGVGNDDTAGGRLFLVHPLYDDAVL